MKCYICNRETDNFSRDPDGKYVSICSVCKNIIKDINRVYYDIEEEDIKLLKMTNKDFIKSLEREEQNANCISKDSKGL